MNAATVMIVDDEPVNVHQLANILRRDGFGVKAFIDPKTAFEHLLSSGGVDLLLLDLHMPEINGCEFYRLMKKHDVLKGIPVIFITGETCQEAEKFCGFETMTLLTKPLDIDQMRMTMAAILK